jgi:AraC family transcriptional activator of tynA and feaB
LIDTMKPIEYSTIGNIAEVLGLVIERPSEGELLGLAENGTGRRFEGKAGLARILQRTLSDAFEEIDRVSLSRRNGLQNALITMAWDALREQLEEPSRLLYSDMQCGQLKAYVDSHLSDPELSVDSVADGCRISVRSAHRAFERDPVGSISRYIWMRRITSCAAALRDDKEAHRPITDICLSWGFNSTSHFSRLFKDQFGVPPSAYRATHSRADREVQNEQVGLHHWSEGLAHK